MTAIYSLHLRHELGQDENSQISGAPLTVKHKLFLSVMSDGAATNHYVWTILIRICRVAQIKEIGPGSGSGSGPSVTLKVHLCMKTVSGAAAGNHFTPIMTARFPPVGDFYASGS